MKDKKQSLILDGLERALRLKRLYNPKTSLKNNLRINSTFSALILSHAVT